VYVYVLRGHPPVLENLRNRFQIIKEETKSPAEFADQVNTRLTRWLEDVDKQAELGTEHEQRTDRRDT
jgi:transposase